ncbi:ABC transporter substrate-binding protein [Thalassospira marina]|uniref:ABC transporter substrate-binding protein n=1 Tax=Thalassospira marina TaxID=2048283 RepID=A0A2N3KZ54_9PROT|nr:ABC transporter substrate-binding protein [Thalassospira marina]AUG51915.1 ABC transporter substrate-binding protein [Thalassospira marina]PKR55845.1 ABC transporter substrate-binding protein [Thalassospira marina]
MKATFVKAALGAALVATTAWAAPTAASAKTLVYCSEGSPEGFNPQLYTSGTTFDATSKNIYNRLVQFKRGTTTIIPGLATSWDVSADGLEYTFHLRKGVKFQTTSFFTPTRDFNADDVMYSFDRMWDKENAYHGVSGGSYEYFDAMSMPDLIKDIVKVDDYTVKFVLNRPEAPFIANMAMDFASILSGEYADKMLEAGTPEQVDLEPVGTGPFQYVQYQKDAVIRYKANPDYWEGPAAIDNLIFAITPDSTVRYQKLKAGECQVMPYPNPADLKAMDADDSINLMSQEGLNVGYLGYNTQKEPFTKTEVRKALNMAINKDAILEAVYQGAGSKAKNPIPPTIWSYNNDIQDDPYDPEAAKKMLADAGYPNGFETDIWAMPVQRPYNPNARRMAEMIQADWAKIGVQAKIVSYEWGEYLERTKKGEQGSFLMGWTGDNGDPDNFLAVLLGCDAVGGSNRAQWCNEDFDKLIQQAKTTSDVLERTRLYEQAQVVFKEQAPWATIAHSVVFEPIRKEVENYKIDPFGGHIFYGVDIKE